LGIEDKNVTVADYVVYQEKFGDITFVTVGTEVEKLRMIKTEEEIENIKKAVEIGDKVFSYILNEVKEGAVEKDLAALMELQMKKLGGEGPSFETIVASNHRSALPHGVASEKAIEKEGFVKFDFVLLAVEEEVVSNILQCFYLRFCFVHAARLHVRKPLILRYCGSVNTVAFQLNQQKSGRTAQDNILLLGTQLTKDFFRHDFPHQIFGCTPATASNYVDYGSYIILYEDP
jgi:hypothetical protein